MDKGENGRNGRYAIKPVAAKVDLQAIGSPLASDSLRLRSTEILDRLRSGIGFRLLAAVLLFSSLVTLTLTALQLYLDYDHEVGVIETRLDEIGRSYLASLGESLWALDKNQLKLQLDGIQRLPGIRAVEIREVIDRPDPIHISVGSRSARASIAREYPLDYVVRGTKRPIGILYVEATLTEVYRHLLNRTLVILASQAAKTFLVSLFILYIFHVLVTRHLITIAGFVGSYNLARPPPPLQLSRRVRDRPDEFDKVAGAFNDLCANLQRAYGDLQQVNAQLQQDLFVRQKAEQDAQLSEQRFRDYAETASDWFWETGPDHHFTYISERLEAFGMDRSVLIGTSRIDTAINSGAEPEKWREHEAVLERHEPFRNFEYTRRDLAGRLRHVSVSGQPVFAPDGRFLGYRGTGTDLTEQHEITERLRQSQKMDAIGQLTGGVAHDFNNVLTVITGTIEIIQEGVADRPELAAIAHLIDEAAVRGAEITSQLLTFARRQPLQPREVDINDLVLDVCKLLKPMLGEHIEIDTLLASDASALADPSQLSAAIVNLAINARDAMPGGGKLVLESANVVIDDAAAFHDGVRAGEFVMIAVADTGQGIPPDIIDRVFEPFFTTKGIGRGTGLGLAMVYGFARQTGGAVKIESEQGRGTVVRLYLPRSEIKAAAKSASAPGAAAIGGQETILVVEDDPLVQGYVIAQLGGLGYKTLIASDAEAALALVDQGAEFDLLFTDVVMPGGMNGRQLAEAVLARRPGMKVLYTSGYTDEFVHDGRLDTGVALLRKPYRRADLAQMIREVLSAK
ncbi:ATP-binding protein [uncultured Bradyrhizobium sp.]|uniref:ATP-binding protein n=1 Tax=uncultured Bradyrhizobium sp. TaxID=199684 RepID=UPI002635B55A|nr:ATP-binding protein [uncultured Bradyrhizobium sp.]